MPLEYDMLFADEEARMRQNAGRQLPSDRLLESQPPTNRVADRELPSQKIIDSMPRGEYDDIFAAEIAQRDARVRVSLRKGVSVDPDKAAGLTQLSRDTGIPLPVVERNEDEIRRMRKVSEIEQILGSNHPALHALRRQFEDPAFAALAQDDVPTLATISRLAGAPDRAVTSKEFSRLVRQTMEQNPILGPDEARAMVAARVTVDNSAGGIRPTEAPPTTLSALASGVRSALSEGLLEQTRQGIRRFFGDLAGFDIAADAQRLNRQSLNRQYLTTPRPEGLAGDVYSGVLSTAQSAPSIAIALASAPLALTAFGVQAAAPAYSKYRDRGASIGEASLGAGLEGTAEMVFERMPLNYFVKRFGRVGAGEFVTGMLAREIPSELATTIAQSATDASIANPDMTLAKWAEQLPGELRQTVIATLVQGSIMGGVGGVVKRFGLRAEEAQRAERAAEAMGELSKLAAASRLRARDVTSFENFMRAATEDGPVQEVFVSVQALQQASIDPASLAEVLPSVREQLAEEVPIHGDFVIPVAEFAARAAGTDLGNNLIPHLRTDADSMSQAEAQTFYQSKLPELQAQVDKVVADEPLADAVQAERDTVRAHFVEQLTKANRFTADVNNAYATLASSFYTTMASRLGITPTEMLKRYPLQVKADEIEGSILDQSRDMPPAFRQWFGDSKVVDAEGKPLVVYHGTQRAGFDTFAPDSHFGTREQAHSILEVRGIERGALTQGSDVVASRGWINLFEIEEGYIPHLGLNDAVYPVYLSIKNPKRVKDAGDEAGWTREVEQAMAEGYDGLVYANENEGEGDSYVAFSPEQIKSAIGNDGTFDPSNPNILNQSATLRRGTETLKRFGLDPTKKYKTREVAAALEARQRAKYGSIERNDRTPEASKRIAGWMVEEVLFEMQHPEKSGVGWYSEKFQRALDTMGEGFPELLTDADARGTMTALIAITSDGQKVVPNFAMAMDLYANFRATGKFTTARGHIRQASIDANLQVVQRLYDSLGPAGMREYLLQERTVSELNQLAKAEGGELKTDYQAHIMLPMAALAFGPKLGAFYANLMGSHGYLTMDRWWSRTFNRYRGVLLQAPTREGLTRFRQLLGQPDLSDDETIAATIPYRQSYEARNFKGGSELEKAANTIYKAAFENLEDAPFNATDRTFMLDAVNRAQKSLKRRGHDLSVADIQAILWYYEKRLYGELGARQSADVSYEEAARQVLAARGDQPGRPATPDAREAAPGEPAGVRGQTAQDLPPGEDTFDEGAGERLRLEQSARGQISFGQDITQGATIALLRNADLSTFIHEIGHFYYEVLRDVATRPDAPEQIRQDMATLLQFVGVDSLEAWNAMSFEDRRSGHEQIARSFEAYLFEGKAPSIELQSLFQRFRAWLINVYRQLVTLNVELSDDVRRVFDRMLAADNVIAEAEAARGFAPLFNSAAEAGMSPEEWASYQALGADATEQASEHLQGRGLRDMKWLRNARGRALRELQRDARDKRQAILAEVEEELTREPVYAAQRFLRYGMLPDGQKVVGAKLDLDALREMYGDGPAAPWRYLATGPAGLAGKEGLHPDIVGDMFGFKSGDELVRAILAADPIQTAIEGIADRRMLERYGDLADPAAIDRAADAAIHNDARTRFVATEFDALARATGQPTILARAARELARQAVARKPIAKLRPSQHLAAEARAGKAALEAMRKGDLVEAATEKRNQLFNLQAFRASRDAVGEIEKGVAYLRTFNNETTRKALDPEYRDQIDQLLERFDMRQISDKEAGRRASLLKWIEEQRKNGIEPNIPDELLNDANRVPFRMLTVEQFRGLVDSVKQIEHLGRLKQRLLTAKDQRAFEAVRDEITESIHANASDVVKLREQRSLATSIKSMAKRVLASHRKFASMGREFDGFKDAGPWWQYITRTMNEAGDKEASMREQATVRLSELLRPILKGDKLGGRGQFYEAVGMTLNREERLSVALNAGNESNLQRLIGGGQEGRMWTPEKVQGVLDTLTKEEWDFVQGVWDLFESYRPEIAAKELRVYGVEPQWIQAKPVETKFGTYRGGYYPVKFDPRQSIRAEEHADAEGARQMLGSAYTSATTRRSFTKARVDEVLGRPLRLSLDTIFQGLNEVVHDLSWHEWLIDTNRLLRSTPLDAAIRSHYGPEVVGTLKAAVRDIAAGDIPAQHVFDRFLNHVRHGTTIAGLAWNLMTSLMQPLGLTQSMVRIGPTWVARGIADWMGSPRKMIDTVDTIYEKSEFMRLRGKTLQREINEIRNTIDGKNSALEASYFWLIQKVQLVADVPTWLGAYHKALDTGSDEPTAVALADQAVIDSQGGGQIKDLAEVQRGPAAWKLFTNFYSFFSTTYNLAVERTKATDIKNPLEVGRLAVDYLLLFIVPATLGALLKAALKAALNAALKGESDDEDKLLKKIAAENLSYLLGTMVLLRELAPAVQKAAGVSEFNIGYGGPAGLRFFQELDRLGTQIGQGDIDGSFLKALNNVGGVLFHYPAGQVNRTVEGAVSMMEGRDGPGAMVFGPTRE